MCHTSSSCDNSLIVSVQICDVSGLGHLSHLRVLNLAGNEITVVSGLFGLQSLTELNLRRNRVRQVVSVYGGAWKQGTVGLGCTYVGCTRSFDLWCMHTMCSRTTVRTVCWLRQTVCLHVSELHHDLLALFYLWFLQFDLDQLPCMQRLFLSHNLIHEYATIPCSALSLAVMLHMFMPYYSVPFNSLLSISSSLVPMSLSCLLSGTLSLTSSSPSPPHSSLPLYSLPFPLLHPDGKTSSASPTAGPSQSSP